MNNNVHKIYALRLMTNFYAFFAKFGWLLSAITQTKFGREKRNSALGQGKRARAQRRSKSSQRSAGSFINVDKERIYPHGNVLVNISFRCNAVVQPPSGTSLIRVAKAAKNTLGCGDVETSRIVRPRQRTWLRKNACASHGGRRRTRARREKHLRGSR